MIDGATNSVATASLTANSITEISSVQGFSFQLSGHMLHYDGNLAGNEEKTSTEIILQLVDSSSCETGFALTVNIDQPVLPTLESAYTARVDLVPGTSYSWTMPAIVKGTFDLATIDASWGKIFDDTEVE